MLSASFSAFFPYSRITFSMLFSSSDIFETTVNGKARTVYVADNLKSVYSDIQFLLNFVYWTIQFGFILYNIDI